MIVGFSQEMSNFRLERCEGEVEGPDQRRVFLRDRW